MDITMRRVTVAPSTGGCSRSPPAHPCAVAFGRRGRVNRTAGTAFGPANGLIAYAERDISRRSRRPSTVRAVISGPWWPTVQPVSRDGLQHGVFLRTAHTSAATTHIMLARCRRHEAAWSRQRRSSGQWVATEALVRRRTGTLSSHRRSRSCATISIIDMTTAASRTLPRDVGSGTLRPRCSGRPTAARSSSLSAEAPCRLYVVDTADGGVPVTAAHGGGPTVLAATAHASPIGREVPAEQATDRESTRHERRRVERPDRRRSARHPVPGPATSGRPTGRAPGHVPELRDDTGMVLAIAPADGSPDRGRCQLRTSQDAFGVLAGHPRRPLISFHADGGAATWPCW